MAGQKLKKQEKYKEEQIKRRATHISTKETTTTEKYFLFTLHKFSNLIFLRTSSHLRTSTNEKQSTSLEGKRSNATTPLLIFNTSSARILKISQLLTSKRKQEDATIFISYAIFAQEEFFPPKR